MSHSLIKPLPSIQSTMFLVALILKMILCASLSVAQEDTDVSQKSSPKPETSPGSITFSTMNTVTTNTTQSTNSSANSTTSSSNTIAMVVSIMAVFLFLALCILVYCFMGKHKAGHDDVSLEASLIARMMGYGSSRSRTTTPNSRLRSLRLSNTYNNSLYRDDHSIMTIRSDEEYMDSKMLAQFKLIARYEKIHGTAGGKVNGGSKFLNRSKSTYPSIKSSTGSLTPSSPMSGYHKPKAKSRYYPGSGVSEPKAKVGHKLKSVAH